MTKKIKKILVIEDEIELISLISEKLKKENYEVLTAMNGEEGYKAILKEKPDLVLLDIIMPVMDGYEVLEKIQDAKIEIPIIIISNSGQPIEIEKTKKLGANDHLIKTDFDPKDLVRMIKLHLSDEDKEKKAYLPRNGIDGPKIVLVEDEEFLRDICAGELSKAGFGVFEIFDGGEAVDAISEIKPDLILLDILLPNMDGFEILEILKKNKETSKIPVLMFSNFNQEEQKERAKSLGALEFIVKSDITPLQIVEKTKKYI